MIGDMHPVVAIDGPSGAGKGTVARAVARELGWRYVDTGAMYRAVAWEARRRGLSLEERAEDGVAAVAAQAEIDLQPDRVTINGCDVTGAIRTPEIDDAAARVARLPRVRKALVHALDRKPLTGVITKKPKDPPIDMYGRGHPWHCPDTAWPEYNPEKAKALLADYGKPVKFTLNIVGLRDLIRVAETFQAYWKEVGVEVDVKPGPRGPQWARAVQSGKFDVWWNNYGANADPSLVAMNFHSKSRANIYKVNDPEVDKAVGAMKAARGKDARYKASCNLQQVLADQIRWLGWEQGDVTVAMWPYVKGLPRPINIWPKYYRVWLDK